MDAKNKGEFQEPPALKASRLRTLEKAIGHEVRRLRRGHDLTVTELAERAKLSSGMLSKIENGLTSASLSTLQALAGSLSVTVSAFFKTFQAQRDATFVKAGQGLAIERRGTRNGHQYQLLGHSVHKSIAVEPYLITIEEPATVFPSYQHAGSEFLYMLEGIMEYQHNGTAYRLEPGDSLFFDGDAPHGPENLIKLPIRFLSITAHPGEEEE